jgi:hypothetical protein
MASPQEEFEELLAKAPGVPISPPITGMLVRTPDETKFGIITADGRTITLSRSAYKSHKVVSGSIVEVEIDPEKLSDEERTSLTAASSFQHKAWGAWWDVGPALGGHFSSLPTVPPWVSSLPASLVPFILASSPTHALGHKIPKPLDHSKPPPSDVYKHPVSDTYGG